MRIRVTGTAAVAGTDAGTTTAETTTAETNRRGTAATIPGTDTAAAAEAGPDTTHGTTPEAEKAPNSCAAISKEGRAPGLGAASSTRVAAACEARRRKNAGRLRGES